MILVDVSTMNRMESDGALHAGRLVYALLLSACLQSPVFGVEEPANDTVQHEEPYRPENGKFPPLDKSYPYRGELIFVDHANRRGSIRVQGDGKFYRNEPHPFAMLPYGIVRYHNAPADSLKITRSLTSVGSSDVVSRFIGIKPRNSVRPSMNSTSSGGSVEFRRSSEARNDPLTIRS